MFYDVFSKVCTEKKMSMSSVLDKAGLSRGNLARWKSGINPKLETIISIADILQIPPAWLLSEEIAKKSKKNQVDIENILLGKTQTSPEGKTLNEIIQEESENQNQAAVDAYLVEIKKNLSALTEQGMKKAVESVELIAKIPEYQKETTTPDEPRTTSEQREKEE